MGEIEIMIGILIVNFIITFFVFILSYRKVDKMQSWLMAGFMLVFPIAGPLYLFLSWVVYSILYKSKRGNLNPEELSFRKRKIDVILEANISEEINRVPIEEALIIADKFNKRGALLNLLKSDYEDSLNHIAKAVENEDGEVSHYAASALTESISQFRSLEKKGRINAKSDEDVIEYITYVYNFLSYRILPIQEHKTYLKLLLNKIKLLNKTNIDAMTSNIYQYAISLLMEDNQFEEAQKWVELAITRFPDDLQAYKAGLQYYFSINNRERFLDLLNKLKASTVVIDHHTLELIRYFKTNTGEEM